MFIGIVSFTACSNNKDIGTRKDMVIVYDSNQAKILEIDDQKTLDYFSELIGNTTNNMDNEKFPLKKLPKDAKISYRYELISKRDDGAEHSVDFIVYKNYSYITMKGVPLIPSMTWEISQEENNKLQNPDKEIK